MLSDYSELAIAASKENKNVYCKFITPNDIGLTGGHQSGYHISKSAWRMFFDSPGEKGENKDKNIAIEWQDDFETISRVVYYGTGTRNEYRLTRFGRGFSFLNDENLGSLLVLIRTGDDNYKAYVLQTELEIENYLNFFNISADKANGLIHELASTPASLQELINEYVNTLDRVFPSTIDLASEAREIFLRATGADKANAVQAPDSMVTGWIDTEFSLFKSVEAHVYSDKVGKPFSDIEQLIDFSNTILNRRKSRAGRSLEHHLAKIFDANDVRYTAQGITEGKKKPDFIFPSIESYHDTQFGADKLTFLGAKTTCKDRWRQVLNEADRIPHKYLFTLQQGISSNQLDEMKDNQVTLVIPEKNINTFPPLHREDILSLKKFISIVK